MLQAASIARGARKTAVKTPLFCIRAPMYIRYTSFSLPPQEARCTYYSFGRTFFAIF